MGFVSGVRITCGVSEVGEGVLCSIEMVARGIPENVAAVCDAVLARIHKALPNAAVRSPSPTDVTSVSTVGP